MEKARISSQHGTHESRSSTRAANKSAAAQDTTAQAADTNGFSFLLASLGDGGLAADVPDATALAADAQDPAALAALQSGLPYGMQPGMQALAEGAATDARWQGALGGANTLAGAGTAGALAGLAGLPGQNGLSGMAFGAEKAGLQSLVGQTAMLDGAAETAGVNGTAVGGGAAPWRGGVPGRFQSTLAAAGVDAASGAGGALNSALRGLAKDDKKGASSDPGAASAAVTAAAAAPSLDRRDAMLGGGATGVRGNIDPSLAMASAQLAGVAEAAAGGDARSSGRGGESPGQGTSALTHAGVGESGPELSGTDAAFSLDAAVDPAQAAMEEQLAEQVAFWVNQKTQSAEITLDRDGQPVEVTVSLTGTEAHVTFRSDQADTREMLDTTVAQLRDLLQSEGLQLSGVTVGSSGGQGARDGDAPQGDPRQGARHATVQAAGSASTAVRAQQVTDRSVDIFV